MPKIVIAEDDDELRGIMSRILQANGYDVVQTSNGTECLKAVRSSKPDLVITDLIMPEMEGMGLIMELCREFPGIRIIAVSGGGRMSAGNYLGMARMLGAVRTFHKPFNEADLLREIHNLLETPQAR